MSFSPGPRDVDFSVIWLLGPALVFIVLGFRIFLSAETSYSTAFIVTLFCLSGVALVAAGYFATGNLYRLRRMGPGGTAFTAIRTQAFAQGLSAKGAKSPVFATVVWTGKGIKIFGGWRCEELLSLGWQEFSSVDLGAAERGRREVPAIRLVYLDPTSSLPLTAGNDWWGGLVGLSRAATRDLAAEMTSYVRTVSLDGE